MKNKKTVADAILLLTAMTALVPAVAQAQESHPPRLVDQADILTDEEEQKLAGKLDEISERQQLDVDIVTVYSLNGKTSEEYADDFYDYNGYGMGENNSGILLLIGMEERDWAISTCGDGIPYFTDAGQEYMVDLFRPYLSDGEYYDAFYCFAQLCDSFIEEARTGEPYDVGHMPGEKMSLFQMACNMGIGLFLALMVALWKKSRLRSVRRQATASAYMRDGSLRITARQDMFINKTVTCRVIESSSSSGGSSTHTGSSGTSHGGSSGKF